MSHGLDTMSRYPRKNEVWVLKVDGPPLIQAQFRDQKVLCSILFDEHSPIAQIIFPNGKTINGEFLPTMAYRS